MSAAREAITLQLKAAWWAERARETPEAELEAILWLWHSKVAHFGSLFWPTLG